MAARNLAHRAYLAGIMVKGFDGVIETVAGIVFLGINSGKFMGWVAHLSHRLLTADPDDHIALALGRHFSHFSVSTKWFAGAYLAGHGAAKIFLVVCLWQRRKWAYPAGIAVFSLFILYQIHRFFHTHSATLLVLSGIDALIVWLIFLEYRRQRHLPRHRPGRKAASDPDENSPSPPPRLRRSRPRPLHRRGRAPSDPGHPD